MNYPPKHSKQNENNYPCERDKFFGLKLRQEDISLKRAGGFSIRNVLDRFEHFGPNIKKYINKNSSSKKIL